VLQALLAAGRFSQAARVCEKTAEALEKAGNLREAMEMYDEASAHHMGESASAAGNRCKASAAMLRAKLALDAEDEGEKADMYVLCQLAPSVYGNTQRGTLAG